MHIIKFGKKFENIKFKFHIKLTFDLFIPRPIIMVKLQISQKDVLLIIMDYLNEHKMLKSLISLERES